VSRSASQSSRLVAPTLIAGTLRGLREWRVQPRSRTLRGGDCDDPIAWRPHVEAATTAGAAFTISLLWSAEFRIASRIACASRVG
jgi:hypothetical protein